MKKELKKIWDFLWKSNSVWSWIVDFVLIFLIVKFVIFPTFGFILSTKLPFVIIESGSMEHKIVGYGEMKPNICGFYFEKSADISADFDTYWKLCGSWYEHYNITKEEFQKWRYWRGMNKGDIIVVKGLKNYDYKKGDVIIFRKKEFQRTTPIIHRIVDVKQTNGKVFSTKGDHNSDQLEYEKEIDEEQVIGKAIIRIPKLGWFKLFFVELFR